MDPLPFSPSPFQRFQSIYSKKVRNLESLRNANNESCIELQKKGDDLGVRADPPILIKLKQEMVLLVEQDLILMRQLLTMHDKIHDLQIACNNGPHSGPHQSTASLSRSSSTLNVSIREEDYDTSSLLSFQTMDNGPYFMPHQPSHHQSRPEDLYAIPQKSSTAGFPAAGKSGFDRNSSILRIPIPPSRQVRHPPGRFKRILESPLSLETDLDGSSSGVSTSSNQTLEQQDCSAPANCKKFDDFDAANVQVEINPAQSEQEHSKDSLNLGKIMTSREATSDQSSGDELICSIEHGRNVQNINNNNRITSPNLFRKLGDQMLMKNGGEKQGKQAAIFLQPPIELNNVKQQSNNSTVYVHKSHKSSVDFPTGLLLQSNSIDSCSPVSPSGRNKIRKFPPNSKSSPTSPVLRVRVDNLDNDHPQGLNDAASPRTSMDSGVYFGGPLGVQSRDSPTEDEIFI